MAAGDRIQMDTDGVVQQSEALTARGTALGQDWSEVEGLIAANEPAIADDLIGGVFHAVYDADSARARETAGRVPVALTDSAEIGYACALLYRAADANGAAAMPAGAPRGHR